MTKKLGDVGKKIHTARSRNDQVITALRLYYKDGLNDCKNAVNRLIDSIAAFVKTFGRISFPGYTHMRKAMPSTVGLWGNSFIDSMRDNVKLVDFTLSLLDQSPLGTGAGYGVPLAIDRAFTAEYLGFKKLQKNPLYVQLSRGKFESTILHTLTQIMLDFNKIASDLILFTMPEFNYFSLPDEFCTGSSIMPHKKNPDVLELLRAQYHSVIAYELQVKNTIGNLISGFNRDLQLTKEPTMRGLNITKKSCLVTSLIFTNLRVNEESCKKAMTDELFAVEEVYKLVQKGVPFRDAYRIVAKQY